MKSIESEIDVSTELKVIGQLEAAKWKVFLADKKTKDPGEKTQLYDQAKELLADALSAEPNFRGAFMCLERYRRATEE